MHDESIDTIHAKNPERDPKQIGFSATALSHLLRCLQDAQQERQQQLPNARIGQEIMHQCPNQLQPVTEPKMTSPDQSNQIVT